MGDDKSPLVLVTGATGYLAAHIIKKLNESGYRVRGTVRNLKAKEKYEFLINDQNEFVQIDLVDSQAAWDTVVQECSLVVHVAQAVIDPRVLIHPEEQMITPAVEGTKKVFDAASRSGTVSKAIVTSSVAALNHSLSGTEEEKMYGPEDWNEESSAEANAYGCSKMLMEKVAFSFDSEQMRVVSVLPSFIVGPPLGPIYSTSIELTVLNLLIGKLSPNFNFGFCDVVDVASLYLKLIETDDVHGRYIISDHSMPLKEVASILKKGMSQKNIKPKIAPTFVVDLIAKYAPISWTKDFGLRKGDREWIVKLCDSNSPRYDTSRVEDELGMEFHDIKDTLVATAEWLFQKGYAT